MKKLTDGEVDGFWSGDTIREVVQAAYDRGYQDAVINADEGLRKLFKDVKELDTNEERDAMWHEYQKNRNR